MRINGATDSTEVEDFRLIIAYKFNGEKFTQLAMKKWLTKIQSQ